MKVPIFDLGAQVRSVRPELDAAIARSLDSCAFCLGPEVEQFERDFAAFVGTSRCVGFNSGTSALHVGMRLLDLKPGDEVVTTPFTFIATSWAIVYTGAKPVYVDVDEKTLNLDPRLLEKAITPRTKAVMPVHLYGHPFDVDAVLEVCRRHGVPDFSSSVISGTAPVSDGRFGADTVRILEAAQQSVESRGREVRIEWKS